MERGVLVPSHMKTAFLIPVLATMLFAAPFISAAPKNSKPKKSDNVTPAQLLTKFDEDKDGKLAKDELSKALKSLKSNSVSTKKGIDKWDTDKDGKLNLKELAELMKENK
jgi:Ca2+-binding EF-hand superfamily protein